MKSSFKYLRAIRSPSFWLAVTCYLCGCAQPELIEPPSFPYDRASVEASVLSPTGDLLSLDGEAVGALVFASTRVGQSPLRFMDHVFSIIDSIADLEHTSNHSLRVAEYALTSSQSIDNAQYGITVEGGANAWVEVNVECGQNPGDESTDAGSVALTVFASSSGGIDSLRPSGVAWGSASECELWDDDATTIIDGDFAIILPVGNAPTLFKFFGTQSNNAQTTALDYEGYATEALIGIVVEEEGHTFTVALSDEQVVINDCHGQWSCDNAQSRCMVQSTNDTGFISSCSPTEVLEVMW
jgi:hypothetical protein